ncbi:hypothetical protein L596_012569 [Steinernema carpocapsae]|uniref:7TM GPCR serpentine receptor class x (Srx) domain-containing protein n=1 Tax=Steinernema carpocapsae TaxID=34508 RepID=A0A4U5NXH7_STECR|nr:hypothetical protein L596_012569 [Steinernema carpocapsae]
MIVAQQTLGIVWSVCGYYLLLKQLPNEIMFTLMAWIIAALLDGLFVVLFTPCIRSTTASTSQSKKATV